MGSQHLNPHEQFATYLKTLKDDGQIGRLYEIAQELASIMDPGTLEYLLGRENDVMNKRHP
jgi:hypothetical protein